MPTVGAPSIQSGFGVSYELTAAVLLVVPIVVALFVETPLFLLADRYPRKWFVCGGLFAMAAAAFAAAAAPNLIVLGAAMSIAYIAGGAGIALSEATLIDAYPDRREQMMTRWTLLGELGDLAAPILIAALAWLAIGWRGAYVVVGALVLVWAIPIAWGRWGWPSGSGADAGADAGSIWQVLRQALGNRSLMVWLLATTLCELLDEIFVVFASLHLRDALGASVTERSLILAIDVVGSALGLALADRLLRRIRPLRVLAVSSAGCAAVFAAWVLAPSLWLSAVGMFAVGAATAPLYPIAIAQAYAAMPGHSGTVNAAGRLFAPLSVAMPWLLGVVADHLGTTAALWLLLVQPLGLLVIATVTSVRHPTVIAPLDDND